MNVLILMLSTLGIQDHTSDAYLAVSAIRSADEIVASMRIDPVYWDAKAKNAGKDAPDLQVAYSKARIQRDRVISMIDRAGGFAEPIRLSLIIESAKKDEQGRVVLDGIYQVYTRMVSEYRTQAEIETLEAFDVQTEEIKYLWGKRLAEGDVPDKEVGRHDTRMVERDGERSTLEVEIDRAAKPRKDYLEMVHVKVVIPEDMMGRIKVDKLMGEQRVLIMMQVEEYSLRAPLKELSQPAAVGSISGTATWIVSYMRK